MFHEEFTRRLVHTRWNKGSDIGCPDVVIGWMIFDDRVLRCLDIIRKRYGACTVNTHGLTGCGFRLDRPEDSVGQHYFGRAADPHILAIEKKNLSKEDKIQAYDDVRDELRELPEFKDARFEYGITWLHNDFGNADNKKFYPSKK